MFTITMLQWNDNNPDPSAEEKVIQTIPAKEEGDLKLINPVVKCEMGNAETFDFSIEGGTKYYDSFHQMQTYIGVKYDGDYIFSGRVLTVDTTMYGTRRIRCEGALTYFGDTPVQGEEESKRKKQYIVDYMRTLLESHNYFVGNGPRYMTLSETPGNYSGNKTVKDQEIPDKTQRAFGSDGNTDTKSILEDLRSYHGGYFRTRVAPGGIRNGSYLDWMDNYFSPVEPTEPTIELGKNIIDFSSVTEVDNIFTILIPVGKKTVKSTKSTSNSTSTHSLYLTDYLLPIRNNEASEGRDTHAMARAYVSVPTIARSDIYDPNSPYYAKLSFARTDLNKGYHTIDEYTNATNLFGWIYKTVTFDTAETQEELFKQAMEWIKTNYSGSVTKFTIKAVDMHQIGENTRKIMVGDLVKIVYPVNNEKGVLEKKTITLTCLSVSYDLYNPENNTYTFGKPANALTKTYGVTKKGKSVDKVGNQETSKDDAGGKKPSEWLTKAKSWLRNHRLYYTGRQYNRYPYIDDYGDNYQNGVYFIRSYGYGYNLRKAIPNQYVPGVGTVSWILDKNDPANHIVDGEIHFDDYDDIAENDIVNSGLIPYVYYQYGVDLQNINGVKVPAEAYGNDGKKYTYNIVSKTDLTKSAIPIGDTPQLVARIFDNETRMEIENGMLKKTFFYKGDNNTGVKVTAKTETDENGNTTNYKASGTLENTNYTKSVTVNVQKDDVEVHDPETGAVYTSIRSNCKAIGDTDLKLTTYSMENDKRVGWIIHEGDPATYDPDDPETWYHFTENAAGQMILGIENYKDPSGNEVLLTVSRISGQLMYMGNNQTKEYTAVSLNHMDQVCGDWHYETDPTTGIRRVYLETAGGFRVRRGYRDENGNWVRDDNGKLILSEFGVYDENNLSGGIVAEKLADGTVKTTISGDLINITTNNEFGQISQTVGKHTKALNDHDNWITTYEGTEIYQNKDHIANVAGQYTVEYDENGQKKLVVQAGGGIFISKNGTEFGLYDKGNLTGGVMVERINGEATTKIAGSKIEVTATHMASLGVWRDSNRTDKAELMIEAINGNTTATLNTDKLKFTGTSVNLSNKLKIRDDGGTSHIILSDDHVFVGSGTNLISLNDGQIRATSYVYYDTTEGVTNRVSMLRNAYIDTTKHEAYIKRFDNTDALKIGISGNTLSITDIAGNTLSFSKATSLGEAWSGGNFPLTISAIQKNSGSDTTVASKTIGFTNASDIHLEIDKNGDPTASGNSGKYINVPYKVVHHAGNPIGDQVRYQGSLALVNATSVYNNGWSAARSDVSLPGTNTNSNACIFKIPNSTVDGAQLSRTYRIYKSTKFNDDDAYVYLYDETNSRTVAQLNVGELYNSVGIKSITAPKLTSSYSWDPTITATADNGQSKTRKIWIEKIVYNSKDYVVLKWESSSGDIFGGISAESIYTKGVNSVEVTSLTAPIMDNDETGDPKITALASNGEKKTRTVWLERSTYKASGETRDCVNARWDSGSGSIIGRIRTDQVYSAGYTDGYDAKHDLYISGEANWNPLSSPQTIDPGGHIKLWPSFEKTNGGHDGSKDPFVVEASTPSISVSAETSWYATGSESDAKSAAAQAMKTTSSNLSVKKLSKDPSRWAWCKAYYSGDTAYILLGF